MSPSPSTPSPSYKAWGAPGTAFRGFNLHNGARPGQHAPRQQQAFRTAPSQTRGAAARPVPTWALRIVEEAPIPSRRAASCCIVDVVNGGDGLRWVSFLWTPDICRAAALRRSAAARAPRLSGNPRGPILQGKGQGAFARRVANASTVRRAVPMRSVHGKTGQKDGQLTFHHPVV
jgi:hypothetical protein